MYNNKQYRIAQSSFGEGVENLKQYFQGSAEKTLDMAKSFGSLAPEVQKLAQERGITSPEKMRSDFATGNLLPYVEFAEILKKFGYDFGFMFLQYFAGDKVAQKAINLIVKQAAKGGVVLPLNVPQLHGPTLAGPPLKTPFSGVGGMLGLAGSEILMNVAENIKGDLAIYIDYMSDYEKDLAAISKLYPKDENIKILIDLMKDLAIKGLTAIKEGKSKKTSRKKNYRIAIVGEANWGSYAHQGLSGAAFGAGATKTWQGALATGLGFALADAGKDVFHNFQDTDYKATALAAELHHKTKSMANQLDKYDKGLAEDLRLFSEEFENYFRKYIYAPDAVENFRNKNIINLHKKVETPHLMLQAIELEKEKRNEGNDND
jgi:hypothetical protein